jgi:RND family efflux transporter MFP subunit
MTLSQKLWIPLFIAVLCVAGAFLIVGTAPSIEYKELARAIPTVRTIPAQTKTHRHTVRTQGTVTPRTEADLIPEISGRVVWIAPSLAPGGFFKQGEPLLRLERRDFELAVKRQRAAVRRAESESEFATSELDRRQGLSDAGFATASQLSEKKRTAAVAESNLIEANATLEQTQRDLARTEIRAPFDGRVRNEHVDVGQFVGRGNSVGKLYATDYAEIRLPIPDHQLEFLNLPDLRRSDAEGMGDGPRVILRATFAGRRHEWSGRIVRSEAEIDSKSRMVNVVARVDDPYAPNEANDRPPLAVGLFVAAEIIGPDASDVIVVPRYAMRADSKILIVNGQNELRSKTVEVLRIDRDDVLVQGPLGEGERICVSPIQVVVEGMIVNAIEDQASVVSETDRS